MTVNSLLHCHGLTNNPARKKAEKKAREQQWQIPKEGESQGGTSITLAIRSPERPS